MQVDVSGFLVVRDFPCSGQDEAIVNIQPPNRADCADYLCKRTPTTVRSMC